MNQSKDLFTRLTSIGYLPEDSDELKLSKKFLVLLGIFMGGGGILWGTICLLYSLYTPMLIPYSYTVITIFNLYFFYLFKKFSITRTIQVFISLLLPFLFQWSLGGFIPSGGVQLWALLALVGSISFQSIRHSLGWLMAYVGFSTVSFIINNDMPQYEELVSTRVSVLFFSINFTVISAIVTGLVLFFVHGRDIAVGNLKRLTEKLEEIISQRTAELQNSLVFQSAILDNIVDGLVAIDLEGGITGFNPAILHLFELKGGITGKNFKNIFRSDLVSVIEKSIDMEKMISSEVELSNGKIGKAVSTRILRKEGEAEVNFGTLVLVRDITKEKQIDRMKTEFISNVSHELRTPLTSILGFTRIIKKKLEESIFGLVPDDDKKNARNKTQIRDNIDIIVKEGERLTSLINDVLDIAKMEAGKIEWKMSTISMNEIVDRAIASTSGLFTNSTIEMHKEIEPELPPIIGDRDRLIQVIINLISNAYKFTNDGRVVVRSFLSGNKVVVSVVDSGIGIQKEDQPLVFEKFKQVGDTLTDKPKGTGLGLPICKQIIEHHNGIIWVESELGKGSTFSFSLPVMGMIKLKKHKIDFPKLIENLNNSITRWERDTERKTILLVDDEKNIRDLLRQELEYTGYNTIEAEDGQEALIKIEKNQIDLIILDVMMPELNGFDLAMILRSNPLTMSIPILILSIVEDEKKGIEIGVDEYEHKPIQPGILLPKVQNLIQKKISHKKIFIIHDNTEESKKLESVFQKLGHEVTCKTSTENAILESLSGQKFDLLILDTGSANTLGIEEKIHQVPSLRNLLIYIVESA